jgi:potassium-transporting ATPase ATP-binding subunit
MAAKQHSIFDPSIVVPAIGESLKKLNPVTLAKNPVMFVTEVGAAITTVVLFEGHGDLLFLTQIALWLWFTVLFANFAEAMAEGRGKAQAKALRATRTQTFANRLTNGDDQTAQVPAEQLRKDDVVLVKAGELIPGDGDVIEGAATVDESAIT